jgi:integrase
LAAGNWGTAGGFVGALYWRLSTMPSIRRDRGNGWWARVVLNGRQIACKMFPPGKKGGPEWRAAKQWEEEQTLLAQAGKKTLTGLERLLAWGDGYLDHVERTMGKSSFVEKTTHMQSFFGFCRENGINSPEEVTTGMAHAFISSIYEQKSAELVNPPEVVINWKRRKRGGKKGEPGSVANKYRKNLLAAWNWGVDFVEGFPKALWPPFAKVKEYPVEQQERYVPPEEDVIKVLRQAHGQDLVMLLTYYFTGGRKSELFRLSWERDIRFDIGRIRLTDRKGKDGKKRVRWYDTRLRTG